MPTQVGSHNPHLISFRKAEDGQHILQSTYTTRATLKVQAMITNKIDALYRSQLADVGETMLYMGEG